MTRKKAIEMLKSKMDGSVDTSYEWAETVRMAIEALQAESTHGRPIDASWVINEIHKNICDMCEQAIDIEDCNDCKIEKIKKIIYSAPTISVEVVSEDMQTKTELTHIKTRLENVEKRLQGLILYGGVIR